MNKKLVAVAVAGVLAAPLAAQAQTANVTLYGRLNLDYEIINGKQAYNTGCNATISGCEQPNPTVSRLSSNSSRLGVRGVEALGGGLSAIFQIESNVSGDTGNNSNSGFASRETFVGLQGSWGTFKMGNFLMPMDDVHNVFGNVPTFGTSILNTAVLWGQGQVSKQDGSFDARLGNSLRYDSPIWAGFNFSTQVSLRDSSGFQNANSGDHLQEMRHAYVWGIAGYYNNGPIQGGIAYESNTKVRVYAVPGGNFYANDWAFTVSGAYNFGIVRPAIVYQRLNYDTPTGTLNQNMWGVSFTAPIGPGAAYLFWGGVKSGGSAAAGERVGGVTAGGSTNAQQISLSYTYPLSKRTQVYAGYTFIDNQKNSAYTWNINSYTVNTSCINSDSAANQSTCGVNGRPQGLIFGMIHLF